MIFFLWTNEFRIRKRKIMCVQEQVYNVIMVISRTFHTRKNQKLLYNLILISFSIYDFVYIGI